MCDSSGKCRGSGCHEKEGSCGCEARHDKFIDAAMLVLIAQDAGYGYDLVERLKRYGFEGTDPTKIYRRLRRLEGDGLLSSAWQTESSGPARRSYTITREGIDFLLTWRPVVMRTIKEYSTFLDDLAALQAKG